MQVAHSPPVRNSRRVDGDGVAVLEGSEHNLGLITILRSTFCFVFLKFAHMAPWHSVSTWGLTVGCPRFVHAAPSKFGTPIEGAKGQGHAAVLLLSSNKQPMTSAVAHFALSIQIKHIFYVH